MRAMFLNRSYKYLASTTDGYLYTRISTGWRGNVYSIELCKYYCLFKELMCVVSNMKEEDRPDLINSVEIKVRR